MSQPQPTPAVAEDRHGRILAELAGLSLALARDLQARAMAAEDADEAVRLATAFQRVARGVRQTLALELKVARYRDELARERSEAQREQAAAERAVEELRAQAQAGAVRHRQFSIAAQVEPLIWDEREPDDSVAEDLQERLEAWLDEAAERPDFTDVAEDDLIVEALRALGFEVADPPGRTDSAADAPDAPAAADSS